MSNSFLRRAFARSSLASIALTLGALAVAGPSCGPVVTVGDCPDGLTACDGACVDVESNEEHCGSCDNLCVAGSACTGGVCGGCPPGFIGCGGTCVDPSSDPLNCGGCDLLCAPGSACVAGACGQGCPFPLSDCQGICVDTDWDPANCGGCGLQCPGGVGCVIGSCGGQQCPPGLVDCFGVCTDILWDSDNCGACGASCGSGGFCENGVCQGAMCPPGQVDCFGFCTDILWDSENCGGCGVSCGPGGFCDGGVCQGSECPPGLTLCAGQCVDISSDFNNCGGCSFVCDPDETCQGGACVDCMGGVCGVCGVQDLGSLVPQSVNGTTLNAPNGHTPSCVPAGSGELGYLFTAPAAGTYVFDTINSQFDTALSLRLPGNCSELACNDDSNGTVQSQVSAQLAMGQEVLVVVDGFAGNEGGFTLHINTAGGPPPPPPPPPCVDGDLGSMVPQTITGSNAGGGDDLPSTCGAPGGPDRAYTFTAPASASYTFNTFGSSFDTVLHLRNGSCNGATLGCNDDVPGSLQSQLTASLTAGQTVIVVVDGFGPQSAGTFVLNVSSN